MNDQDFEKLGVFYLGRGYDLDRAQAEDAPFLYDSRDLLTHGVCIGMTGSGKTGLSLALLEEAAIDGIPVIAIDPKGDIANLALNFPELSAADLEPWLDEDECRRKGQTRAELATQTAEKWRQEQAAWGQGADRRRRLKDACEVCLYTPGAGHGRRLSMLKSLSAPPPKLLSDPDLLKEKIANTVSSLLSLLGIEADPLRSREHILLSNILHHLYGQGQSADLVTLIELVNAPPLAKIGALDLEAFYPAKQRFELSMLLNNLLAAPGVASWLDGEAMDIDRLLYTDAGKPKISIISIAHLGDSERMFAVSLLLSEIVAWMRLQSGTTSLRAIVYMDEIAGYFPPVANPPAKAPLMTLLKQARAFGVGVLLASQNPVDLDYKGLSNTGTWFIGRLQTERDKMRVLEGLESAGGHSGQPSGADMDKILSSLGNRIFLMHNVHEGQPKTFQTRCTLSYLKGPLSREELKRLSTTGGGTPAPSVGAAPESFSKQATTNPAAPAAPRSAAPVLPPEVAQYFLPARPDNSSATLSYKPMLLAFADVRYSQAKHKVEHSRKLCFLANVSGDPIPVVQWEKSACSGLSPDLLSAKGASGATYAALPVGMNQKKSYTQWGKELGTWIAANKPLALLLCPQTGDVSMPDETERDFRIRIRLAARTKRDQTIDELKAKYGPKLTALDNKLRNAEFKLDREQREAQDEQLQAAINIGSTLVGAFMGRKVLSTRNTRRAASAARGVGRAGRSKLDAEQAHENVEALSGELAELQSRFASELSRLESEFDPSTIPLDELAIAARKSDIVITTVALAWVPFWRTDAGDLKPAW